MAFSGPFDGGVFRQENGTWEQVSIPAHTLTILFSVLVAYSCTTPFTATMSKQLL